MRGELLLLLAIYLGVAFGAKICASWTSPERNYYPMQRIIWSAFSGFGGLAVAGIALELCGIPSNSLTNRLAFALILLAAILYSAYFIRRRNKVWRYVPMKITGQPAFVDVEVLRQESERVTSVIYHGDAPEEWVEGMEEAVAHWRQVRRFRAEVEQRNTRRRAARGIE